MNDFNAYRTAGFTPTAEPALYTERGAFVLTGFAIRTTNAAEAGPNGRIGNLWKSYYQSGLSRNPGLRDSHLIYALYTAYESDASGAYTLLVGHESAAAPEHSAPTGESIFSPVEAELTGTVVPESRYRIFKTRKGPIAEVVGEAWKAIWAYFEQSKEERTFTGDFELYDTRNFDPDAAEVLIHIAVR